MWKRDEQPNETPAPQPDRAPQRPPPPAPAVSMSSDRAVIGRSIKVRGDVTGDEDLVIQGRVEGSVDLAQHSVTVGPDGEVVASIIGRVVTVEGRVEGNIDGSEQVTLRSSAHVHGDLTAPRVVLEDGARFRGLVDMGERAEGSKKNGATANAAEARNATGNGRTGSDAASGSNGRSDNAKTPSLSEAEAVGATSSAGKSPAGVGTSSSGKVKTPETEAQVSI